MDLMDKETEEQKEKLRNVLERLELTISDKEADQFIRYYRLLVERNKVMNLTAITDFDEVIEKHFLDSLSIAKAITLKEAKTLTDIGSGAGFPGLPLKIVFPHLNTVLADSLKKRLVFLQEVITECSLEGITAVHGRAEDLGKKGSIYRENSDLCVSRAVANLSTLAEYCLPFVNKGGRFVAYKGFDIQEEAEKAKHAVSVLGGEIENIVSFKLPGTDLGRSFVIIRKKRNTPGNYPRKAGLPGRQPL